VALTAADGSYGGGRFADADAARTLVAGTAGLAVCLLTLYAVGTIAVLMALVLLAVGLCAMDMAPSTQHRVIRLAGPGGALAQSLPASAANVGIALGSFAGGVAIGDFSASATVIAGLLIAVTGGFGPVRRDGRERRGRRSRPPPG
jgi:MFS transporter, DHA1 family, inner membrane transport protein